MLLSLHVDSNEVRDVVSLCDEVLCFALQQNGGAMLCCHLHAVIPVDMQLVTVD